MKDKFESTWLSLFKLPSGAEFNAKYMEFINSCERKAEQGEVEAQYRLGRIYSEGAEAFTDDEKELYWYEKAAEQGHEDAVRTLRNTKKDAP